MAGAGIAGLCVAWELARHGLAVTVLEDGKAATEAAAGLLQVAGGRLSTPHLKFRQTCFGEYPSFLASLPLPVSLRQRPHLKFGGDEAYRASFAATMKGMGIRAEVVPEREAVALPAASLDPESLRSALERALERLEVRREKARLVCWHDGSGADDTGQVWAAEITVLCCGAGLASFDQTAWNWQTEEGWGARYRGELELSYTLEAAGQTLVTHSCSSWRVGGSLPWQDLPPIGQVVSWQGKEVARVRGVRCKTPDGLPVAGLVEKGLYVLGGLGRNGLLTAPLLARGLAQSIVTGRAPEWLEAFSPRRSRLLEKRPWSR